MLTVQYLCLMLVIIEKKHCEIFKFAFKEKYQILFYIHLKQLLISFIIAILTRLNERTLIRLNLKCKLKIFFHLLLTLNINMAVLPTPTNRASLIY